MPARDTQVSQSGQEPSPKKFSGHRMSQDASSPLQNDPQGDDMICTQGTQPVVKQITDEGMEDGSRTFIFSPEISNNKYWSVPAHIP